MCSTESVVIFGAKPNMSEKKVRTGKISKGQKLTLLEILRGHRSVAMGQFGGPNSVKSAQAVWETVVAELNACGPACKTSDQWKKTGNLLSRSSKPRLIDSTKPLGIVLPPKVCRRYKEVLEFFPAALVGGDGGTIESGFQEENKYDMEVQETLEELLAMPGKEVTEVGNTIKAARAATSSFSSAFEEVKELMNKQEEKRCSEMAELMNVLKTMSFSLQSIDSSLKRKKQI